MSSPRWTAVSDSADAWEADAIAFLRERLPDPGAYRRRSHVEFVGRDGSVDEVPLHVVHAGDRAGVPRDWLRLARRAA